MWCCTASSRVCWMFSLCCSGLGLVNCTGFVFLAAFSANFRWRRLSALFIFAHTPPQAPVRGDHNQVSPQRKVHVFRNNLGLIEHVGTGPQNFRKWANDGLPGHVAVTSALAPTADVRAAMFAFGASNFKPRHSPPASPLPPIGSGARVPAPPGPGCHQPEFESITRTP